MNLDVPRKRGWLVSAPFVLFLAAFPSCRDAVPQRPPRASADAAQWEHLKSWSGSGSQYLDSFTSDTGALRIEWEARRAKDAAGRGSLTIVMHSAISGRPLAAPIVDHVGEGKGTAFVSEEPRVFFASVIAQDMDWTVSISERVR